MIVVKVEMQSAITGKRTELGRMLIGNTGSTAHKDRGDYTAKVLRKGAKEDHPMKQWKDAPVTRTGEVKDYPRLSYNVWRLVARAILSAFPEERG